jgi:hypothetical protein
MICDECKNCDNFHITEVGCFGSDKPCEYFHSVDYKEYLEKYYYEMIRSAEENLRQ